MGALVTNNEAGDSVPDWPLAYGGVVPFGHLQGAVVYEYFHRVMAGTVGLLTITLAAWALFAERRLSVRIAVGTAFIAIVAQALLGGIRVRLGETHSYGVATTHAIVAQVVLCALAALAFLTSPQWRAGEGPGMPHGPRPDARISAPLAVFGAGLPVFLLLQTLLGAGYRHKVFGVEPHVAGAVLVSAVVVVLFLAARRETRGTTADSPTRALVTPTRLALVLIMSQFLLGPASYFLLRGSSEELRPVATAVIVAVLHLGVGSALLVTSMSLSLWALRLRTSWAG
jgi:cytochrome c oxidase assembly protein subunit 15